MGLMDNPNRNFSNDVENWAYPPEGGRVKMIVLGILVPLPIIWQGVQAWITQEATWLGNRGASMEVHGDTARALAVTYLSVAAFFHFRWFWGLLPVYRVFTIGCVLAMICGLGGCGAACYYEFR